MRRLICMSAFLLVAAAVPALAESPKAVPLEPIKNFDLVARGDILEHTFEIRNDGNQPLEITDVRPACGCTVAEFDKNVAPGKVGKIHAKVDTTDFMGPISKSIAVFTNDAENPKLQLVVKAKVKPFIGADPGYARYIYVQGERVEPIGQTLWAEDGHKIKIVSVKAPYDHLKVSYRPAKEEERNDKAEGDQWRVEILLDKDAPVGALREYVEIVTDHPRQKVVRLPISGFVRPRQHITPMELDFGKLQGDTLPLRRTFHFTSFITDAIELPKIETGVPGMTATAEPSERQPGHRFKMVLNLGPDMPKGPFNTVVKIHTTDPQNPLVELPIEGVIE